MKKDIFIDNNIAKNFSNPMDPEYKSLIQWLMAFNPGNPENAYLVVSQKLLGEYSRTSPPSLKFNIWAIINQFIREGRLIKKTNEEIKEFQRQCFTKKRIKDLRCNNEDHCHIATVLLSDRKYALSLDDNFIYDLRSFPRFKVKVEKRPEDLPYR
ncbi:MAG: hypothetical protein ACM3SY_17120 [Candidatus Omnitrophota bacterium]